MPIEIRRIEYTEIELRSALSLYHAKTEGGEATEGRVSGIKVTGGREFNVVAKVAALNNEVVRKAFDHATIIGVMVLFSKHAGIPLPRAGQKVLSPTQYGGVAMTIKYEHTVCDAVLSGQAAASQPRHHAVGHA